MYGDFQRACESGKYSSLVGWIIKQGKTMLESGEERIQEIREVSPTLWSPVMF